MPTPSSNPPPELPPRSHSSSCPDELRASTSSWRPDQESSLDAMHVDSESRSPGPVSAPPPPHQTSPSSSLSTATSPSSPVTEDVDIESRSNTESPRPESRGGRHAVRQSSADDGEIDGPSQSSGKARDDVVAGDEVRTASHAANQKNAAFDMASPAGTEFDKTEDWMLSNNRVQDDYSALPAGYELSNIRIIPTTSSSYLRPGSKFHGTQQSERQIYDVQVEIKYVDLRESFLCGYLKIQGLTEDNPTLTTYFEGEIIGSRYSFITDHPTWGATEKTDISHWNKFTAFRPYSKSVRKGVHVTMPNLASKDNIFMRWKEHFLVPDHRVRTINGASFEGFYYICFNQREGSVSGIYFHARSEKFQQLELKHVEDRGCFGAMEFR